MTLNRKQKINHEVDLYAISKDDVDADKLVDININISSKRLKINHEGESEIQGIVQRFPVAASLHNKSCSSHSAAKPDDKISKRRVDDDATTETPYSKRMKIDVEHQESLMNDTNISLLSPTQSINLLLKELHIEKKIRIEESRRQNTSSKFDSIISPLISSSLPQEPQYQDKIKSHREKYLQRTTNG